MASLHMGHAICQRNHLSQHAWWYTCSSEHFSWTTLWSCQKLSRQIMHMVVCWARGDMLENFIGSSAELNSADRSIFSLDDLRISFQMSTMRIIWISSKTGMLTAAHAFGVKGQHDSFQKQLKIPNTTIDGMHTVSNVSSTIVIMKLFRDEQHIENTI